jgi:hypothetical protein
MPSTREERDSVESSGDAGAALFSLACFYLFYFAIIILYIAGMWKMFAKAGKPGWAAIIPIYNIIILCEVAGRPGWWVLLFLIPIVNIVILAMISIDVAASFGKSTGYGIGLWLLGFIFYPMLGFGDAQYVGPAAAQGAPPAGGQQY